MNLCLGNLLTRIGEGAYHPQNPTSKVLIKYFDVIRIRNVHPSKQKSSIHLRLLYIGKIMKSTITNKVI